MSVMMKVGWMLVGLGVITLLLGTMKLKSKQEVFSVGDFKASATTERTHPRLQYVGAGLVVVGGLIVVLGWGRPRGR
jgi:uncharacterized membrane protein YidH (DUF202 family)